ncbi:MAG: hypothetical protein EU536_02395 [Promethearchaeota archaeon]|nr:MAG: hypothetical protein EU536_02395 [Candidatus Lokiarchaeota archaeon]
MPPPIVFLMILDQVRADILYDLIQSNKMPYLKKYIFDRAAVAEKCFTGFPTNTIPGHIGILTGTYANRHHLHHMRFWNRTVMPFRLRDYSGLDIYNLLRDEFNPDVKMLYEFFDYSEAFTTNNFAKGADYTYLTKLRTIIFYLIQKINYKPVLKQSLKTFLKHFKINLSKNFSEILYVLWLPISDLIGHARGPLSNEFRLHLEEIDRSLFKILFEGHKDWQGLQELGLLNSTYFIITADHGSFMITHQSELIKDLKENFPLNLSNKQISLQIQKTLDLLVTYTDGIANLYVKNPHTKNWIDRATFSQITAYPTLSGPINLIDCILKIPTVSHVFVPLQAQNSAYLVFSPEGTGKIQRRIEVQDSLLSYSVQNGKDPLDYTANAKLQSLIDGNFHPFNEWLPGLSETQYPMILDQIPRIFDCSTSPDLLFMGKEGHSFSQNKERGTHDTGTAICTRVPLIIAGPSIRHTSIPIARTVDIVPTTLHLLGKPLDHTQFDGRILFEIIEK